MKIVSKKKLEENEPSENEQKKLLSLYQCGKLDDANELALLFTQKYSQHALGWKVLGALLGQAGQYIAALEANRKAVEISPSDAKAHNNLGATFMKTGKLDDAVSFVETYIIKMTEWCWQTRVKLLNKKRRKK